MSDTETRVYKSVLLTYSEFQDCPMGRDIMARRGPTDCEKAFERLATTMTPFEAEDEEEEEEDEPQRPWVETAVIALKLCSIIGVLYMFVFSLDMMGEAFIKLGGKASGRFFRECEHLSNPMVGLAFGILATVLLQSSSTSMSIIITMAATETLTLEECTYLVMGANIGTSVTSTIVSMAHINNQTRFKRAFTGAVFHDIFNWFTVGVFLPVEAATGALQRLSSFAVEMLDLKPTVSPRLNGFVNYDKTSDGSGVTLLVVALSLLTVCLLLLVRLLESVMQGTVVVVARRALNKTFPCDNFVLMVIGAGCTASVSSSSIVTSVLVPLAGIGALRLDRLVVLTHGANIGTTLSSVVFASTCGDPGVGLTVAFVHVFLNIFGTVVWFVIRPLRPFPASLAKLMGSLAHDCCCFPVFYVFFAFHVFPGLTIALSLSHWGVSATYPLFLLLSMFAFLTWVRRNRADVLPWNSVLRQNRFCGSKVPDFMWVWGEEGKRLHPREDEEECELI